MYFAIDISIRCVNKVNDKFFFISRLRVCKILNPMRVNISKGNEVENNSFTIQRRNGFFFLNNYRRLPAYMNNG